MPFFVLLLFLLIVLIFTISSLFLRFLLRLLFLFPSYSPVVSCGGGGGSGGGEGGTSTDTRVKELAARISERLPKPYDLRKAHPDTFKVVGEAVTSLGVFLSQVRFHGF